MKTLVKILDADLDELMELHLRRSDRRAVIGFYTSALRHYLEGDRGYLAQTLARLPEAEGDAEDKKIARILIEARLAVRAGSVSEEQVKALEAILANSGDWAGEVQFVLALCHEARGEKRQMSARYQQSAVTLSDLGARKKAVKALLNHVAAESAQHPDRHHLREYEYVYRQAKRVKNFSTAAVALLNISHEYHDIGALQLALSHVNRAVALLDRQKQGRSYYLALAHRAHVLFDMDRKEEGRLDYEALLASAFADLAGVRETLEAAYGSTGVIPKSPMVPAWMSRHEEFQRMKEKLGSLEQKLLKFVADSPREKADIIEHLYGDKLSWEVLENRFNNTLSRLKKKCPGIIVWEKGKYRLSSEMFSLWTGKTA
jgi:tetratricopeptide (TPR) repeat protein